MHVNENLLAEVERIGGCGAGAATAEGQVVERVIAVIIATPAPVEVELCLGSVIAVANEAVAASAVEARVEHRTRSVDFILDVIFPYGVGHTVVVAIESFNRVGIAKEEMQGVLRRGNLGIAVAIVGHLSATGFHTIVHLDGHTAMVHQCRHCVDLSRGAAAREGVGHLRPLVGGGSEVDAEGTIVVLHIAVAASALAGVVPIFHHLGHSGSHTAGHGAFMLHIVIGTEVVVVGALIPRGGEHGGDSRQGHRVSLRGGAVELPALGSVRIDNAIVAHPVNLLLVGRQPVAHLGIDILRSGIAERVGQHRLHAVVGSHNDEALGAVGEDIESVKLAADEGHRTIHGSHTLVAVRIPEIGRHLAGGRLIHGLGNSSKPEEEHC